MNPDRQSFSLSQVPLKDFRRIISKATELNLMPPSPSHMVYHFSPHARQPWEPHGRGRGISGAYGPSGSVPPSDQGFGSVHARSIPPAAGAQQPRPHTRAGMMAGACYSTPKNQPVFYRPDSELGIQPPGQYNSPAPYPSFRFPATPPSTPSSHCPHFIRASQYRSNLSSPFVPSFTSSAVPPITEHATLPSPAFSPPQLNHSLSNSLSTLASPHPGISCSTSSVNPACCSTPSNHHSDSYPPSHLYSPHSFIPFRSVAVATLCHLLVPQPEQIELPTNHTKRPFERSSHSPRRPEQILIREISPKHPKPSPTIAAQGPFDHRHPYLYSSEPFKLENSPELHFSRALVFPCAQQEADPEFNLFPLGPGLAEANKYIMANQPNSAEHAPAVSNHNLVGHRIDNNRLELMSVLGLGAYGVVYLARDLTSPDIEHPRLYAVKALNKIGLDARQKSFQRREIALHSLASSHPSIVTLHAVIESPSCIFVILDYCPDGDLFGMITEKQRYLGKTQAIKKVFIQIVEAVQFCHRLGISHRDLKPENILCKKRGDEVVLADFGLATAERTSSDFGCGSTFYMSPECQGGLFQRLGSYSTFHNDIWSLGVILVNLTCGRNPWKQACPSDETFRAYLNNPDFLRSILPISEPCNALLKRIFSLNPMARMSLEELKNEVLNMETFNMSVAELSRSTKATREAARAWRQDVPASPKPPTEPTSWKNTLVKNTKKQGSQAQQDGHARFERNVAAGTEDVWKQPVQYEESSSSSSATTAYHNESSCGPAWRQSRRGHMRSPAPGFHPGPAEVPRIRSDSPPPTPRSPIRASGAKALAGGPTGPLVSAFTSASISNASSSSDDDQIESPRGFSGRFCHRKQSIPSGSNITGSNSRVSSTRKKLFIKPMGFTRPNAPSPIVVKPYPAKAASPCPSSPSKGLATPTIKKGKHSTLTFLPSTPPATVSPGATTFGFDKKSSRFFCQTVGHEAPSTSLRPNHAVRENLCRRRTPARSPPILSPRKKTFDQNKFSLFSSSEDEDEEVDDGGIDADFDIEEDDHEEKEEHKNSYAACSEWLMINGRARAATSQRVRTRA